MAFSLHTTVTGPTINAETLPDALAKACQIIKSGGVVLRIEGSDGFMMERADIALECARRATAQTS